MYNIINKRICKRIYTFNIHTDTNNRHAAARNSVPQTHTWDGWEEIPSKVRRTHLIVTGTPTQLSLTAVDIRK